MSIRKTRVAEKVTSKKTLPNSNVFIRFKLKYLFHFVRCVNVKRKLLKLKFFL